MKLFKKAAAVALAAVLSLSMLTACGGGGSGASTKLAGILASGQLYMDVEVGNERVIQATDGTRLYVQSTDGEDQTVCKVWILNGKRYELSGDSAQVEDYSGTLQEEAQLIIPTAEMAQSVTVGKYTHEGTEYYAETLTVYSTPDGQLKMICCFSGNKMVYAVLDGSGDASDGDGLVLKVNEFTSSIPAGVFNLPQGVTFTPSNITDN